MFFCLLSSLLFLLVYSLMQNSYYNDNRRHGVSLTLKNSLCASLFARAHEPPRDQRMYNIISFFFCYFSSLLIFSRYFCFILFNFLLHALHLPHFLSCPCLSLSPPSFIFFFLFLLVFYVSFLCVPRFLSLFSSIYCDSVSPLLVN